MGAPWLIINETKNEYIMGTGSSVYSNELACLLSMWSSLNQKRNWADTDTIVVKNVCIGGVEDLEYEEG